MALYSFLLSVSLSHVCFPGLRYFKRHLLMGSEKLFLEKKGSNCSSSDVLMFFVGVVFVSVFYWNNKM